MKLTLDGTPEELSELMKIKEINRLVQPREEFEQVEVLVNINNKLKKIKVMASKNQKDPYLLLIKCLMGCKDSDGNNRLTLLTPDSF